MKRPLYVRQDESHDEDGDTYWYRVSRGSGPMLTSETYPSRSNAIRAARAFIAAIEPVQVEFSYWTGRVGEMVLKTERVGNGPQGRVSFDVKPNLDAAMKDISVAAKRASVAMSRLRAF